MELLSHIGEMGNSILYLTNPNLGKCKASSPSCEMKEEIDYVPEFSNSSARSTEADFPVLGLLSYLLSTGGPKCSG